MATMEWITQARDNFKLSLTGSVQQSGWIFNAVLAANTSKQYTIPGGIALPATEASQYAQLVLFAVSGGADLYVQFQATGPSAIAVPTVDVTNGSGVELISSAARLIRKTDRYISLISPVACIVTMAFYGAEVRQ
jgi:hypothetical protein